MRNKVLGTKKAGLRPAFFVILFQLNFETKFDIPFGFEFSGARGRDIELLESDFNLGFGYFLILNGLKLGSVALPEISSKI